MHKHVPYFQELQLLFGPVIDRTEKHFTFSFTFHFPRLAPKHWPFPSASTSARPASAQPERTSVREAERTPCSLADSTHLVCATRKSLFVSIDERPRPATCGSVCTCSDSQLFGFHHSIHFPYYLLQARLPVNQTDCLAGLPTSLFPKLDTWVFLPTAFDRPEGIHQGLLFFFPSYCPFTSNYSLTRPRHTLTNQASRHRVQVFPHGTTPITDSNPKKKPITPKTSEHPQNRTQKKPDRQSERATNRDRSPGNGQLGD